MRAKQSVIPTKRKLGSQEEQLGAVEKLSEETLFMKNLYEMELERIRYIVNAYHRARLTKVTCH